MASCPVRRLDTDEEVRIAPLERGPSIASDPYRLQTIPPWLEATGFAINNLVRLQPNWNNRGARAVDTEAAQKALELLVGAGHFETPAPDVVPTVVGGLQLEWHRCRMDIELEISPQRVVTLYLLDRDSNREWEGSIDGRRPSRLVEALSELTERSLRNRRHAPR